MKIIHQNEKGNRTFYLDQEKNYCVYDIPDIVAVLPILPNGQVILVEQYRVPADARTIELVCGGIEKGETVEHAAKREVEEEIGYKTKELKKLENMCLALVTQQKKFMSFWHILTKI